MPISDIQPQSQTRRQSHPETITDRTSLRHITGFPSAQTIKNLPAMQETWVRSLGWEDPLEKAMLTHSSIPAWRIPWTQEPGGLQSMGNKESDRTEQLTLSLSQDTQRGIHYIHSSPF